MRHQDQSNPSPHAPTLRDCSNQLIEQLAQLRTSEGFRAPRPLAALPAELVASSLEAAGDDSHECRALAYEIAAERLSGVLGHAAPSEPSWSALRQVAHDWHELAAHHGAQVEDLAAYLAPPATPPTRKPHREALADAGAVVGQDGQELTGPGGTPVRLPTVAQTARAMERTAEALAYGSPAYKAAALRMVVAGQGRTSPPSVLIKGYQPGNGSRYDLTFARRAGGGWLVVWDAVGWFACVYRSSSMNGGPAELSRKVGDWNDPDAEAVAELAGALFRAGVL